MNSPIARRQILSAGLAATSSLLVPYRETIAALQDSPVKRVGLIGTGWYGKADLFRLIQVAPVEVVSLCDVDSTMLSDAADMVKQRQKSGNRPRTYSDYRKLLAEKDLDIVLIATPDHWHALPMIEAVKNGADVYVQKPISVDVIEGQAMLAAARKYNRVVQVGTQRRSTPHLMEAKQQIVDPGMLGRISHAEIYCYYHMRARENPPDSAPPANLDYEMWTGPAPMLPYNKLVHPRSWRAFNEYGNGILGDMCIHMLDTVRWMLGLGWPTRVSSQGGIYVDKASRANITDTQTAVFEFPELNVQWTHRSWGDPPDPAYPWGATLYGEKGTLKLSVNSFDFIPRGSDAKPIHRDVKMELEEFPEDKTEKDLERHVAPAIRVHMLDFLKAIAQRGKPVADIEQGHISTASCILANLSMKLGRTLTFDPGKHVVVGDDQATAMLRRPYRAPWIHPEPNQV
ncbi:MAG: Gfo/Idh/MocA family protein [Planctomycetota bacterium]